MEQEARGETREERVSYVMEEESSKFIEFLKRNVLNFLITGVVAIFLTKDLVEIERSGKTIVEIIANSVVNLVVGQLIKNLFLQKGSNAGFSSRRYVNMMNTYSKEIEKTDVRINKLDDFCDYKNEQRIVKAQKQILRIARIKYDDFLTKEKKEMCKTKQQEQAWEKAESVKIQLITPENLLSETDTRYDGGKKDESLKAHRAKVASKSFVIATGISVIFGYFVPRLNNNMLAGLIWNLVQVAIWLAFGIIAYYQEYTFITNDYSQRTLRKIAYLVEFNGEKGEWVNYGISKNKDSQERALQSSEGCKEHDSIATSDNTAISNTVIAREGE